MPDKGMTRKRQATGLEVTYRHWFCLSLYYNIVLRLLWRLSRSSWRGTISVDTITASAGGGYLWAYFNVCLTSARAVIHDLLWFKGPIRMKLSVGGRFLSKSYQSESRSGREIIGWWYTYETSQWPDGLHGRFRLYCLWRRISSRLPRRARQADDDLVVAFWGSNNCFLIWVNSNIKQIFCLPGGFVDWIFIGSWSSRNILKPCNIQ